MDNRQAAAAAIGLIPAAWLVVRFFTDDLGANPIEEVTHETGTWALRLLLASLAVTPLRRILGSRPSLRYRRTLGLLAFGYATLHFSTWMVLDHFFDWQAIVEDIFERPYVTAGFTAFVCLLPLALTSTRASVRRLGKRWVRLHKLAYAAAAAAVVHYWWLVKSDVTEPFYYAAALALLLVARLPLIRLR
jgi:sulfoxide reductase heme-binding subunit YedZ